MRRKKSSVPQVLIPIYHYFHFSNLKRTTIKKLGLSETVRFILLLHSYDMSCTLYFGVDDQNDQAKFKNKKKKNCIYIYIERNGQKISNLWVLKGNIVQHKKFIFERKMSLVLEGLYGRLLMGNTKEGGQHFLYGGVRFYFNRLKWKIIYNILMIQDYSFCRFCWKKIFRITDILEEILEFI